MLGPGCANCKNLERVTRQAVDALGLDATIEKVEDYPTIAGYGIMSTPALVVDEKVVVSGRVPTPAQVRDLLTALAVIAATAQPAQTNPSRTSPTHRDDGPRPFTSRPAVGSQRLRPGVRRVPCCSAGGWLTCSGRRRILIIGAGVFTGAVAAKLTDRHSQPLRRARNCRRGRRGVIQTGPIEGRITRCERAVRHARFLRNPPLPEQDPEAVLKIIQIPILLSELVLTQMREPATSEKCL